MATKAPRKPTPAIVIHLLELLQDSVAHLGLIKSRAMFGGWGIWVGEVMVALVADEEVYLKTHPDTVSTFIKAGCQPFVFTKADGKSMQMSYYTAPDSSLDSANAFLPWARLACDAAFNSKNK